MADSAKMVTAIARMLGVKQDENDADMVRSACVEGAFERMALVEAAAEKQGFCKNINCGSTF